MKAPGVPVRHPAARIPPRGQRGGHARGRFSASGKDTTVTRAHVAHDLFIMAAICVAGGVMFVVAVRWFPGFRRGKRITEP